MHLHKVDCVHRNMLENKIMNHFFQSFVHTDMKMKNPVAELLKILNVASVPTSVLMCSAGHGFCSNSSQGIQFFSSFVTWLFT